MSDTIYCEKCDDLVEYKVKSKKESYNIKNENIEIKAKVAFCKECRTELFHQKLDKINQRKIFDIYRKRHKLLSPEEIKEIRAKYHLNQKEMSQLLGWGEITYHRYENGAVPDSAHNNQLLLIRNPRNVKELLNNGKTKLTVDQKEQLKKRVNKLLDTKNKLVLNLSKNFYNKLKVSANNNDLNLNEYVTFLLTQEYFKKEKERELKKYKLEIKKQLIKNYNNQEAEKDWLEGL
ncbi:MAG: type II toxin-antitoxin system MqsA family antitoxin [Halanaerobiales bacterium]|nr:type II toxin-antitoxin system MqsA family antitoxin [Halanaerobiales bacterium]